MKIDINEKVKAYLELDKELLEAASDLVSLVPELQREDEDEEKQVIEEIAKALASAIADEVSDIWHYYHDHYYLKKAVKNLYLD